MRRAAALILTLVAGEAAAQDWWQGVWAWDKAWCTQAEHIGSVTPAPIAITRDEVLGYENSCRIVRTQPEVDFAAVKLWLECQAEGETYDEVRLILNGGEAIWVWFGGDEPVKFQRCAGPLPGWWPKE